MRKKLLSILLSLVAVLSVVGLWPVTATGDALVSAPGQYSGYSPVLYNEWKLNSQYVAMRDGTKLAMDIFRPAVNGVAVSTPYPVLWVYIWGTRALYRTDGTINRAGTAYTEFTKYGYVVAVVDARGTGASYGQMIGSYARIEARDTYDVTEWLAAQPWCDGKVGMFGCSHSGQIEFLAAGMKPPHLKAIFPQCYSFDYYFGKVQGGIPGAFRTTNWYLRDKTSVPMDEDPSGAMLAEAVEQHKNNPTDSDVYSVLPFENSFSSITNSRMWIESSPGTYIADIESSSIPIYQWSNWNDFLTKVMRDAFIFSANLDNVRKTSVGPLGHCQFGSFNLLAEERRWFDYWLKGIDNGIMNEPQFYYCTTYYDPATTPPTMTIKDWRFAWQWPIPNQKQSTYFLGPGPSCSKNYGVIDGILSPSGPSSPDAKDVYNADYTIAASTRDAKGMTYTGSVLTSDTEVIGYPQVHLWVSSNATDGDFFAFLEDVDSNGKASVVTQLQLRASHRVLNNPPFDNVGQPWHRNYEQDYTLLTPGQAVELVFDPLPVSYVFKAGHYIRLTISNAYPGSTFLQPPGAVTTVYRSTIHASYLTLPIVAPVDVLVRVEPQTLNLKSKGEFTVFIDFPKTLAKGCIEDIDFASIKCNGASAISGSLANDRAVVKFNRQDLIAISPGNSVTLTVTGQFGKKYYYGASFQGSDTVKIQY